MNGSAPSVPAIEIAADGGATVFSARYGEHYHNRNGPLLQARHVFVEGTQTHLHNAPRVLEIGFGFGTNFLSTLELAKRRQVPLEYLAFENDPAPLSLLQGVSSHHPASSADLWRDLLSAWGEGQPNLDQEECSLSLRFEDATNATLPIGWASAIYLDPFSPRSNPELWSAEFISRLAAALAPGGWVATYSAAGAVRRRMREAGLEVTRAPGIAGKREFLRARRADQP